MTYTERNFTRGLTPVLVLLLLFGHAKEASASGLLEQQPDTTVIRSLCEQAYDLRKDDAYKGRSLADSALALVTDATPMPYAAMALRMAGVLRDYTKEDSLAEIYLLAAEEMAAELGDERLLATLWYEHARILADLPDIEGAVALLERARPIIESRMPGEPAGDLHNFLGLNHWRLGQFGLAEYHYFQALDHYADTLPPTEFPYTFNNLGVLYFNSSRYEDALSYYRQALEHYRADNNDDSEALVMGNIGATYLRLGQDSMAREILVQALDLAEELNAELASINAVDWLATLELKAGDTRLSHAYLDQARDYYLRIKDFAGISRVEQRLGDLHVFEGSSKAAMEHYQLALQYARRVPNRHEICRSMALIGHLNMLDGNHERAAEELRTADSLALEGGFVEVHAQILDDLGVLGLIKGRFASAHQNLAHSHAITDSIFHARLAYQIGQVKTHYDMLEKEHEIELLKEGQSSRDLVIQQTKQNNRRLTLSLVVLIVLLLMLVYFFIQKTRYAAALAQKEAELKSSNQALERTLADRERILRILSHDLRGPMASVLDLLKLMQQKQMTGADRETVINSCIDSMESTNTLLANLLSWVRLQAGMLELERESLEVQQICNEINSLFTPALEQKSLEWVCDIQDDATVYADQEIVQTILRNLVSNAVKFTPRGGRITLSVKRDPQQDLTRIAVADTGIGVPAAQLATFFQPEHGQRRKGTEGEASTGLGLMLVHELASLVDGEVQVVSEEGQGTTVTAILPATPQA